MSAGTTRSQSVVAARVRKLGALILEERALDHG